MTRTQPRVGWVRADLAKSVEEYEKINEIRNRVEALQKENEQLASEKAELERLVRNSVIPEEELTPDLLAQGDDEFEITCFFTGRDKRRKTKKLKYSWNAIFQAIGPSMFGYLRAKNQYTNRYDFEPDLEDLIRADIVDDVEGRKIEIPNADIDTIILQFKQLGYILLDTNKNDFTGWTLTEKGETQLTRLKTVRRRNKNKYRRIE
jgi:hypothetical protein